MSRTWRVALLPGDGIGPEVIEQAVRVLETLPGISFAFQTLPVGAGEFLRSGDPLPPAVLQAIRSDFDAVLLGAMGLPAVRWPSGLEMTPQIDLREKLDLYCGLRPIYLFHENDTPLRNIPAGGIDLLLVRENTEGLFASRLDPPAGDPNRAEDRLVITRRGAERLIHAAFHHARLRRGRLALVDKANVLPSMVFFRRIFDEIAPQYPGVQTERVYVDAMALFLVRRPQDFDVLVTENMFGDILSDLAAALVGGMGMAPSADLGDRHGVFQPSHGSAPDIAGKGLANPVAAILSAAMMLEWLGEREGAARIHQAVRNVLSDPAARTPDMGGTLSTAELGAQIASAI